MKKIGIITLYYGNDNYGGIAQAYALNAYIQKLGYDSELISYKWTEQPHGTKERIKKYGLWRVVKSMLNGFPCKLYRIISTRAANKKYRSSLVPSIEKRKKAFAASRELAAHSKTVYTENTIKDCIGKYDIYISGSDQIWNPVVLQGPFVLEFLPKQYRRLSYASSIATSILPEEYGEYMKKNLAAYSWISVREPAAKEYLESVMGRNVDVVVDPTFLLEREEWEKIASEQVIQGDYIFAYLLGESTRLRKQVTEFAEAKHLKIVTLPHVLGGVTAADIGFGDISLYDVGLPEFFSLIKYAKYVVTDSFHGVVFSNIFEKNFYALGRENSSPVDSFSSIERVYNVLKLLGEQKRFVRAKKKIPTNDDDINYTEVYERLADAKEASADKLKKALSD